jgi:quinol monooxygenase YgiN
VALLRCRWRSLDDAGSRDVRSAAFASRFGGLRRQKVSPKPIQEDSMTDQTVTFVNVIDVDPAKQAELVDLLTEGAEKVFQHRPGFVSLTVLASKDRSRVINSAQWRSVEDLQATQADPDAQDYAKRVGALAQGNPNVFSVASQFGG